MAKTVAERRAEKAVQDAAKHLLALRRMERLLMAREELLPFVQVTMPDVNRPNDPVASRYHPARHHEALAAALQKVEAGEWLNLIITMPPRHGKSELASRRLIPWFIGRDPTRSAALGTYSDDLAGDFGRDVRGIMEDPLYQELFPGAKLRKGSKSADRMQTEAGGMLFFVGRGTGITGRGADLIVIDDPLKNRDEADSKAIRDKVWKWWQDDIQTRVLDEGGRFIIIMTRWHEDDLVGRLTDPNNPHFVEEEASKWRVLDLPALARDDDALGRAQGEPLWPARFGKTHLEAIRTRNPRGFAALYQGRPAPEEGDDFKREWIKTYQPRDLPKNLRNYAASDHAIKTGQENDRSCLGCGGVDEDGTLWILPTLQWGRWPPDETVEKMLDCMRIEKPVTWLAENEHISGTMGPFLRRRMRDEGIWCVVEPYTTRKDKRATAATARAMMQAGMVRFPAGAPWWAEARDELLKFPNATHDDFVSWISLLCILVDRMVRARRPLKGPPPMPKTGTMAWVKWSTEQQRRALVPANEGY
jgi:predicted phage terminase large subunit-like protein